MMPFRGSYSGLSQREAGLSTCWWLRSPWELSRLPPWIWPISFSSDIYLTYSTIDTIIKERPLSETTSLSTGYTAATRIVPHLPHSYRVSPLPLPRPPAVSWCGSAEATWCCVPREQSRLKPCWRIRADSRHQLRTIWASWPFWWLWSECSAGGCCSWWCPATFGNATRPVPRSIWPEST